MEWQLKHTETYYGSVLRIFFFIIIIFLQLLEEDTATQSGAVTKVHSVSETVVITGINNDLFSGIVFFFLCDLRLAKSTLTLIPLLGTHEVIFAFITDEHARGMLRFVKLFTELSFASFQVALTLCTCG